MQAMHWDAGQGYTAATETSRELQTQGCQLCGSTREKNERNYQN